MKILDNGHSIQFVILLGAPVMVGGGTLRGGGEGPLLIFLPQISIFGHYLTPQKRENSPQAIINQKNLIDTEKPYKLKISCGQSL